MRKLFMLCYLVCLSSLTACGPGGADTYTISGNITSNGAPLAGVTVTLSGSASGATTTDAVGNYKFTVQGGSYTVTPTKTVYAFTPSSLPVTIGKASVGGNDFTAVTIAIQLPETGQTASYDTGDDGDLLKGVAWPSPRFTDNGNGTVTDGLTGLVWLADANCFTTKTWAAALTSANTLAHGTCSLSDSSIAGAWRLPNVVELESLVDISLTGPALPSDHKFTNVQSNRYWTSSTDAATNASAWYADMNSGAVGSNDKATTYVVWPVRDPQ